MKQTSGFISTYSADAFGVCSALYELGGMVVMHDASGCNSTYTTHDEPRWYDMDSMVYISALTEIEAIMGDDSRLIGDISEAANELRPNFIAIVGTTIPAMTGFDADAAARAVEEKTGIPSFGFATSGMKSYIHGASLAFKILAEKAVEKALNMDPDKGKKESDSDLSMNILGMTPLDFSINGCDRSIKAFYEGGGYNIISSWAMGSSLKEITDSGCVKRNQVVSLSGIEAAHIMKEKLGIPYNIGIPIGGEHIDVSEECLAFKDFNGGCSFLGGKALEKNKDVLVLGEGVAALSLAKYISKKTDKCCAGYSATELDEDGIAEILMRSDGFRYLIADPLFKRILNLLPDSRADSIDFIPLPHEAFSGRMFRNEIPDLVGNKDEIAKIVSFIC